MVMFQDEKDRDLLNKLNTGWAEIEGFSFTPNVKDSQEGGKPWRTFSEKFTKQTETLATEGSIIAEDAYRVIKELFRLKIVEFVTATNNAVDENKKISEMQLVELAQALTDYYFYNLEFVQKLKPHTFEISMKVEKSAAKPEGFMQAVQKINPEHQSSVDAIIGTPISVEEKRIVAAMDTFEDTFARPLFINIQGSLYPAPGMEQKGKGILPLYHARLQAIRKLNNPEYTFTAIQMPARKNQQVELEIKKHFETLFEVVINSLAGCLLSDNEVEHEFAITQQLQLAEAKNANAVKAVIKAIMKNPHSNKYQENSLVVFLVSKLLVCEYRDEFFENSTHLKMPASFDSNRFNALLKNLKEEYQPNPVAKNRASISMDFLRKLNFGSSSAAKSAQGSSASIPGNSNIYSPLPFDTFEVEAKDWAELLAASKDIAQSFSGSALTAGEIFIKEIKALEIKADATLTTQLSDFKTPMIIAFKNLFKSSDSECSLQLKHNLVNYLFDDPAMRPEFFETAATEKSVARYNDSAALGNALLLLLKGTYRPENPPPANNKEIPFPTLESS